MMQMLHTRVSHKKTVVIFVLSLVAILLIGALTYAYIATGNILGWAIPAAQAPDQSASQTKESTTTHETQKTDDTSPSSAQTNSPASSTNTPQHSSAAPTNKTIIPIDMQITQNERILHIATTISAVVPSGACTVTLVGPPAQPITQTSGIQARSRDSACTGFDIPMAQLMPGDWQISLTFENDNSKGTSVKTHTIAY